MRDALNRKIDYMRISVTDRCNLRCKYCMPEDLPSISHTEILRFEEMLAICRASIELGIRKFKITGGEPLVRRGCISFIRQLKEMPGCEQVTLTTNGVLLPDYLDDLKNVGIDCINISLDSMDAETFQKVTGRDHFQKVMESIRGCQEAGIRTKVNSVLLKGVNDQQFFNLLHLARDYELDIRFIEIMPIGYGKNFKGYDRKELLELIASRYPDYEEDTSIHGNGPANYIRIPGFKGSIGFIDAIHGKFCSQCNRIRLTSDGILKLCLYYENGINLKEILRSGASEEELKEVIKNAILKKPTEHQFHFSALEGTEELRKMSQIGG